MKKTLRRCLTVVLAIVMVLSVTAFASAANNWNWQQEIAHQIADLARSLGYGEDTIIVKAAQLVFAAASGEYTGNSYLVDGRTGRTYYLGTTQQYNQNGNYNGQYTVTYTDGKYTVFDGMYQWWCDSYNNSYWYRYDANRNIIRSNINFWNYGYSYNGSTGGGGGTGYGYYPYSGKYYYKGVDLYNGPIAKSTISQYVNYSDAEYLGRLIESIAGGQSRLEKLKVGETIINSKGSNTMYYAVTNLFWQMYNANASLTTTSGAESLEVAYEVLFRSQSTNSYRGWVVPTDVNYIEKTVNTDNSVTITYKYGSAKGQTYTFPSINVWGTLWSPYNTR